MARMADPATAPAPAPAAEAPAPERLRRPVVLAGLAAYLAALGLLAAWLAGAGTAPLPERAFPTYEFEDAWVEAALPHLWQESPNFARIRFRERIDELRWLAELNEMQYCWGQAARYYEEIAFLIPVERHPVNAYVRHRVQALGRREP
jgi:hypothetical protein